MSSYPCPWCHGQGDIAVCPPKCNGSHIADYTEPCRECDGLGNSPVLPDGSEENGQ